MTSASTNDTLPQELLASVEKINKLPSSEEDQRLALSSLYRANNQNALAIETLQTLVNGDNQNGSIYLILGGFCEQEGLNEQAENYYEEALKIATATNSYEEQIVAKVGLAKIKSTNELETCNCWLQEAQADFDALSQSTRESQEGEKLKNLISGNQSVISAVLGVCGDCGVGLMWSGIGINRRCVYC